MIQQLDPVGGALLKQKLEAMGVRVLLGAATTEILGENGAACGLRFKDGSTLETDMVVISCGIRPNVEVAKSAGLAVELVTIAGAGHQWPGGVPSPVVQRLLHTGPPSAALDATQVIWTFFAAHAR